MDIHLLTYPALIILLCIFVLWMISVQLTDVSIVDIWWAPGFAVIAWALCIDRDGLSDRHVLTACLLVVGTSFGLCIWQSAIWDMKKIAATKQCVVGLKAFGGFQSFLLQGSLQLLISLPVFAIVVSKTELGILDGLGVGIVLCGIIIEGLSDYQLSVFKAEPSNTGQVMRRGLWGWSRHPNYFGNAVMWLGFGLLGTAASGPLWLWLGPVIMWFLLLRVSGVTMLEKTIVNRRPAYQSYIEEVSAFFPLPPKSSSYQRGSHETR